MKRKIVIKPILRNLHLGVKMSKNNPWGGPSMTPGVLSERINQNHLAMVGRPHPLKAEKLSNQF